MIDYRFSKGGGFDPPDDCWSIGLFGNPRRVFVTAGVKF